MRANKDVYLFDAPLGKTFDTRERLVAMRADGELVFVYFDYLEFRHTLLMVMGMPGYSTNHSPLKTSLNRGVSSSGIAQGFALISINVV